MWQVGYPPGWGVTRIESGMTNIVRFTRDGLVGSMVIEWNDTSEDLHSWSQLHRAEDIPINEVLSWRKVSVSGFEAYEEVVRSKTDGHVAMRLLLLVGEDGYELVGWTDRWAADENLLMQVLYSFRP